MDFLFVLCICILVYKCEIVRFNDDYLSKSTTNSIKGFFILLVFLSHICGYTQFDGKFDMFYRYCRWYLGQMIVCMFLFYSGYGVLISIKRKEGYMKTFFKNRIIKTWLHFAAAVFIYILIDWCLGYVFKAKTYLLSFVGWESVNNSNWFIFCILALYVFTYISFRFQDNIWIGICLVVMLSCGYIIVMHRYKESWWYDTALCYAMGMVFACIKELIEKVVKKIPKMLYFIAGLLLLLFLVSFRYQTTVVSLMKAFVFTAFMIVLTMKVKIGNRMLEYLGVNLFSLFILQRIPMLVFAKLLDHINQYIYVILCAICTIGLSWLFDKFIGYIDKKLFSRVSNIPDKKMQ